MNTSYITAILTITSLAFSVGAMAEGMSKSDYKAAKKNIVAEHKSDKAACASFSANVKDVCLAEAKGKEKIAKAQLEANYEPSKKAQYNLSAAKAEADYSVDKEKCDDKAGNEKDVCMKEAKAAQIAAKADAKARLKTSKADAIANDKTYDARMKANEKGNDARQDAAADKRKAEYAVAKEKCDAFAGAAKSTCINEAKVRFGQS